MTGHARSRLMCLFSTILLACGSDSSCLISWRVGNVDPRFNISANEVRQAAEAAVRVWESAAGRSLFQYDSINGMPINLRYDERQAALDADREQRRTIDALDAKIARLRRVYESSPSAFAAQRLNEAVSEYNQLIAEYNAKPPRVVEQGSFEQVVERRGGKILGRAPKDMTIYQFVDVNDLTLVIAHEFGHGLGLDHVHEPGAIMNESHDPAKSSVTLQPHFNEANELRQKCGQRRGRPDTAP